MAGAHGVDIVLLHQADVGQHALFVDDVALELVVLVAVDAFEQNGLAVDQQLPVLQFNAAKTEFTAHYFLNGAAGTAQRERQLVQVGILRRPLPRLFDGALELEGSLAFRTEW